MSPLLRDELRVLLGPDQVVLVRVGRELTGRGLRHRVLAKTVVDCAPVASGEAPWDAAIKMLEVKLPGLADRRIFATVILSNHFVRYVMVPWSEALSDEAEEMAFARHCFKQAYGDAAESWELRLSPEPAGARKLASAVDGRLLAVLRALFEQAGVTLKSVQPYLMAVYNNCRASLQKRSAWLVLFEPGCLCLALLQQGRWASVRTMRVGSDWHDSLPLILEREACLAESDTASEAVFLWAPGLGNAALPASGRWQMHNLQPVVRKDFIPEYEGRYALAFSG